MRKNPLTAEQIATCKSMKALRIALGLPRTAFALKVGISGEALSSYELGRVPVRPDMVRRIKTAARKHLASAEKALAVLDM